MTTKYLPCSSAGVYSPVHRALTEQKLHKGRSFTPSINGGPDSQLSYLVRSSRQVAFKFIPTPALPRCLSNKINTTLQSKEKPAVRKLHCFPMWFVLVCSIYSLWETSVGGRTVTHNLNIVPQYKRNYILMRILFQKSN